MCKLSVGNMKINVSCHPCGQGSQEAEVYTNCAVRYMLRSRVVECYGTDLKFTHSFYNLD